MPRLMTRRHWLVGLAVLAVAVVLFAFLRSRDSAGERADALPDVAVHTGRVERATLHRYVTAYGYVDTAPALGGRSPAKARLSPAVGGILAEIHCVEGMHVAKGAVLFRLDTRLAQVAAEKARREEEFAQLAFDRQQSLLRSNGTSQRAFQEAQQQLETAHSNRAAAETALAYLVIRSPLAGTVTRLAATVGQYVDVNTVLAEVVDLERLVVAVDVPGREAAGVAVGAPVLAGGDRAVPGQIVAVGRDMDPRTGTYRVLASLPAGAGFAPGEFMDVRIQVEERRDVLVVPVASLVSVADGTWIVAVEGRQAVRRPVHAGLREGGRVEVSGPGVREGLTIVTDEAYSLPDTSRVHPARP